MAKPVPWKDWPEWLDVYQLVTSEEPVRMLMGLSKIRDWQARARVPISVEASGFVISCLLGNEGAEISLEHIALGDAQTITRFVNLLTDLVQKGFYATSVETLANSIGIPSWIVQLRHTACHGSTLPRASLLRRALLNLWTGFIVPRYWEAQAQELLPIKAESSSPDENFQPSWTVSRLKYWIEQRIQGVCDVVKKSNINIEDEGLYWIVVEFKEFADQVRNPQIYSEILNDFRTSFLSNECRDRLFLIASQYRNPDWIRAALNDTACSPMQHHTLLLHDLPNSPDTYKAIAGAFPVASVEPAGHSHWTRYDEENCTGCYFMYDSLVVT